MSRESRLARMGLLHLQDRPEELEAELARRYEQAQARNAEGDRLAELRLQAKADERAAAEARQMAAAIALEGDAMPEWDEPPSTT